MLGALLAFLVLFALVKIFERSRDDLDNFSIATVAVVPILSVVAVRVILGLLYPNPELMFVLPIIVLVGTTYFLLWKHLRLSASRAAMYTLAILIANEGIRYLLLLALF